MIRPLPYAGHTWSFTQHAVGLSAKNIYGLLKCALPFEGEAEGYGSKITSLMISEGLLTNNVRDGQPDAWRDYQQILPEIGLIYSTKTSRELRITTAGHMFLAGEIGFSELMAAQAIKYQYPNGQKFTIQSRLREELAEHGGVVPETLIELQSQRGVLLKPAILIMRLLHELTHGNGEAKLSVSECQAFLIPCAKNSEWPLALDDIKSWRRSQYDIDDVNRHARRNIQDWFKFLATTDFFDLGETGDICFSEYAKSNISTIQQICDEQEDPATFWIPTAFDKDDRLRWFSYIGDISFKSQRVMRMDLSNEEYVKENYLDGVEVEDEFDGFSYPNISLSEMRLAAISEERLTRTRELSPLSHMNSEQMIEAMKRGAQKRIAKSIIHDQMVARLASIYKEKGAVVQEDPGSIDLLAKWPTGQETIFEVKTVTRRNLQDRLRKAIGQVEEYTYRRNRSSSSRPDRGIVINADLDNSAWQVDFLNNHMKMGLVCLLADSYRAFVPDAAQTRQFWICA